MMQWIPAIVATVGGVCLVAIMAGIVVLVWLEVWAKYKRGI